MNYYHGDFREDRKCMSEKKHWLVGHFMKDKVEDPRVTNTMAVKFWHFKKGETGHQAKYQKLATECTIVIKGKLKAQIETDEFIFSEGEYVVIPPNVTSNLAIVAMEDSEGITIKVPSLEVSDTVRPN